MILKNEMYLIFKMLIYVYQSRESMQLHLLQYYFLLILLRGYVPAINDLKFSNWGLYEKS